MLFDEFDRQFFWSLIKGFVIVASAAVVILGGLAAISFVGYLISQLIK